MKRIGLGVDVFLTMSMASARAADTLGVSMGLLGNNLCQTLIRDGAIKYAKIRDDVTFFCACAG